ncbi:MAG TPA: hypothetical protein VM286_07855 [Candidatus Thermoplasmatota archaeon]|nr:hypothetical protein [Candidatus Thermoplasmatota archaeon]
MKPRLALSILLVLAAGAAQALPVPAAPSNVLADPVGPWSPAEADGVQALDAAPVARAADAGEYAVTFHCPARVSSDLEDNRCPSYVLDTEDIMAQPVLMVDSRNPEWVAFNALHGGHGVRTGADPPFPTNYSRDNELHQPHTTFQTTDGGQNWDDNRYYAHIANKAEVFGEDNSAVLDKRGRMYVSSLYSYREEGTTTCIVASIGCTTTAGPIRYAMLNWKSGTIREPFTSDVNYVQIDPRDAAAAITQNFLAYDGGSGQVAVFWLEVRSDGTSAIESAVTPTDGGSVWKRAEERQALRGCTGMTNPLALYDGIYVGCYAAKGHKTPDGQNATAGALLLYRYDAKTWEPSFVGPTPFAAPGNTVLASAEGLHKGAFVAVAAGIDGHAKPYVRVAFSDRGLSWTMPKDYVQYTTDTVTRQGATLVEERVNAVAFAAHSGTVHMIVMERFAVQQGGPIQDVGATPFSKAYAVVHATGKFLGKFDFKYGDPQTRANFNAQSKGLGEDVFADRHDSIVPISTRAGERIFLAFGDHGYVRFAEATEDNPSPPFFPFPAPPPAIPAALAAANPAVAGAVAGVLSTAMLAALAAARNKKTTEATA